MTEENKKRFEMFTAAALTGYTASLNGYNLSNPEELSRNAAIVGIWATSEFNKLLKENDEKAKLESETI